MIRHAALAYGLALLPGAFVAGAWIVACAPSPAPAPAARTPFVAPSPRPSRVEAPAAVTASAPRSPPAVEAGADRWNVTGRMIEVPEGTYYSSVDAPLPMRRYRMDETEVTADAYAACMRAGACTPSPSARVENDLGTCNVGVAGRGRHPANCVTWAQAKSFCDWAGKRLPTDTEWRYAAQSGWLVARRPSEVLEYEFLTAAAHRNRAYPWGDEYDFSGACYDGVETCAVGTSPRDRTPLGLLDMGGNVREWAASAVARGTRRALLGCGVGSNKSARGCELGQRWSSSWFAVDASANWGFRCASGPVQGDLASLRVEPEPPTVTMERFSGGTLAATKAHAAARVAEFEIDRTPVTVAQYAACVGADACDPSGLRMRFMDDPMRPQASPRTLQTCNAGKPERAHEPLNCANPYQAEDYCAWVNKRLPTADEWEWALRGEAQQTPPDLKGTARFSLRSVAEWVARKEHSPAAQVYVLPPTEATSRGPSAAPVERVEHVQVVQDMTAFRCARSPASATPR